MSLNIACFFFSMADGQPEKTLEPINGSKVQHRPVSYQTETTGSTWGDLKEAMKVCVLRSTTAPREASDASR